MATQPIAFTGISTFSSDFQSILNRQVQIAQLPLVALQNQEVTLQQKQTDLQSLNGTVADVGSSIAALAQLGQNQALSATSSNPNEVSATDTGATAPGTYSITNITSLATAASETSLTGYADGTTAPVSSSGNLSLVYGSKSYPITLTPQNNNLVGLQNAINALGIGVSASILTTSTGANPDYLSVSAGSTGQTTLQLNDLPTAGGSNNLLTSTNQGSNAEFDLNTVHVSRPTNTVNDVVSGLTFNLLGKTAPGETVSLTLNTDSSQLSSALQDFATKYNTLVDAVDKQVGSNAGSLSGDFLIRQIQTDLRGVTTYQGTGSVKSLSDLGITLDTQGHMTFNPTTFNALSESQVSDAFQFLGSSTTGFGELADKFNQLSDPVSGLIQTQETEYTKSNNELTDQIDALNDRINTMQANLTLQLEAADAGVAQLQSQQTIVNASIQAVDLTLFGKNFGSNGQSS